MKAFPKLPVPPVTSKPEIVSSEYTNIQISSIENLQNILDGKQNIVHSYPISSIIDLQTNLDSLTTNINTNTKKS